MIKNDPNAKDSEIDFDKVYDDMTYGSDEEMKKDLQMTKEQDGY